MLVSISGISAYRPTSTIDIHAYNCILFAGGMFQVVNFDSTIASQDNFAPDKITDLKIVESIYGTDYFTIGWTTPGDDKSYGTGSVMIEMK